MYLERRQEAPAESCAASRKHVGDLLGVSSETMRPWVRQHKIEGGTRSGTTAAESEEMRKLRRENAELRCKIAASTYYAATGREPSRREVSDASMTEVIKRVHADNFSVYGVHKMWRKLVREGHEVGRDRVARLMRAAGLRGVIRGGHKTFTTHRDDTAARFPDRVGRQWDTGVTDRIWVADFTYAWTYAGFRYMSFVTDAASRRILGWKAAMSKETPLVTDALEQALSLRRRTNTEITAATGLIHHSDAGSTIGLYTTELIDFDRYTTWKSRQHVETATARWQQSPSNPVGFREREPGTPPQGRATGLP